MADAKWVVRCQSRYKLGSAPFTHEERHDRYFIDRKEAESYRAKPAQTKVLSDMEYRFETLPWPQSTRKFFKTLITLEVLSEEPIPDELTMQQITEETIVGHYSGREVKREQITLDGKEAADALKAGDEGEVRGVAASPGVVEGTARCVTSLTAAANRYVDAQAPWALRKTDPARMGTVLYVLAETIRRISLGESVSTLYVD